MQALFRLSPIAAGFVAVLVGFTSSAAIVFQAASAAGASEAQISSWLWALGIGMAATSIGLSMRFHQPILTAWSTPGAALLATSLAGVSMELATGAFMFSSLLMTFSGFSGGFQRLMALVPKPLASAMLAGVLFQFGINLFISLEAKTLLASLMLASYLIFKHYSPRYVIPLALGVGLIVAWYSGSISTSDLVIEFTIPVWTAPEFSLVSLVSVGIPLFVVTMASQNVPGLAVLRANGYEAPVSPLIGWTGLTGIVLAPFGGFAFNLAAITAAICMTEEADPDPEKRYFAAVWAGLFYLVTGLFGASVVSLFIALPNEFVMAIAGLALLGTIGNSLAAALSDEGEREAALLTLLMTASGISLFGIGSAFWGLLLGLLAVRIKAIYQREAIKTQS
jgi:benzoate membrane transport protein